MRRIGRTSVVGALLGLLAALGCVIAMPSHYFATASLALPARIRVEAPADAKLTPRAQLYGALGPGRTPATLAFTAVGDSGDQASARAAAEERRWRAGYPAARSLRAGQASAALRIGHSPRAVRDVLLGLTAGLLVAFALATVGRRPRSGAR
jgi:hypothetical protein